MNSKIVDKSPSTPGIIFETDKGYLLIEGRSIPENPGEFYEPMIDWVKKYFKENGKPLNIDFKLEYINSGSSKYILSLFKSINTYCDQGGECQVNWHYEEDDEAVQELGEHYKNSFEHIPFNLVEFI
jgi:hypothetical protein